MVLSLRVLAWMLAFLSLASPARSGKVGLVMVCQMGGVAPREGHLASGMVCVLHDRQGSVATAGVVSVYDDSLAVP